MKPVYRNLMVSAMVLALTLPATQLLAQAPTLDTEDNKLLYALGLAIGQQLPPFNLTAEELKLVQRGLNDAAQKKEPQVDLMTYGPKLQAFAQTRAAAGAAGEKAESTKFLDKMAAEEGAVRTASGLVYKETAAGTGPNPTATDKVKVHYHGTFRDGKVFDSSVQRGEPTSFGLNQVIKCWTEGIPMMKVGGKARLVCPSDIAYGDAGRGGIPGGAVLIFDVELLEIVAPAGQ